MTDTTQQDEQLIADTLSTPLEETEKKVSDPYALLHFLIGYIIIYFLDRGVTKEQWLEYCAGNYDNIKESLKQVPASPDIN